MYEEEVVQEIKDYIEDNLQDVIRLKDIADKVCYSPEHISRMFKRISGEKLFAYIQGRRLVRAAKHLRDKNAKIIDTAFDFGFGSHEVFTRTFSGYFGLSPRQFRKLAPEINLSMPKGLRAYPLENKEKLMEKFVIFTRVIEKPARKLIYYPGQKASHYYEYCEEVSEDVWGKLEQVQGAEDEPLGLWLPKELQPEGCSSYVQGVEVAEDDSLAIPQGARVMDLSPGKYLVFQSQPYVEDDKTMMEVIQTVQKAVEEFDPSLHGFRWDKSGAPAYQLIPLGERGYIEAHPITQKG